MYKNNFRKSILWLLCCCLCASLAAQTQTALIDSLERVLASGDVARAEKAMLLVDLSRAYLLVDSEKSRTHAMEALQLAKSHHARLAEAEAYNALGRFYSRNFIHQQAHDYHNQAEKIFIELDDIEALYSHYNTLMRSFYALQEYENTTYYAEKLLTMAVERKDFDTELIARFIIGRVHFREDTGENNFGQEALDYFLNLYHWALHIQDSLGIELPNTLTMAHQCAQVYMAMKRYHEALPFLHKVRAHDLKNNLVRNLPTIYNQLAQAHARLHNLDSARYFVDKALELLGHDEPIFTFIHGTNFLIDSVSGDYLSALANFQKFHAKQSENYREMLTTERTRQRLRSEFYEKDLENRILQQEHQKQRRLTWILTVSLAVIMALFALALFFYRKISDNNRKMKEMNHELKELHTVKDKLFSIVAHDLRSPISSLIAVLRLVDSGKLDAEQQNRLFKDISSRVNNIYNLLDNLLRWSKSQMIGIVPAPALFDAREESLAVTDSLQAIAANKQIVLENLVQQQQAYADRDMFAVVVRNLVSNAIKYTSAEGSVTLASEISGDMLVISIKDTGTGMSQEVQNTLFNLSETRNQYGTGNESGTGLGLVMCADFVKANGGDIWFTSAKGEGSTFYFSVPNR